MLIKLKARLKFTASEDLSLSNEVLPSSALKRTEFKNEKLEKAFAVERKDTL